MGIGMVIVCAPADVDAVQAAIAEPTWVIGALVAGTGTSTSTVSSTRSLAAVMDFSFTHTRCDRRRR